MLQGGPNSTRSIPQDALISLLIKLFGYLWSHIVSCFLEFKVRSAFLLLTLHSAGSLGM